MGKSTRTPKKKSTPAQRTPSTTPRRRAPPTSPSARTAPATPQSARRSPGASTPRGSVVRRAYKPLLSPLAPDSVRCGCEKGDCSTHHCNCVRNGVPCAPGRCGCDARRCTNGATAEEHARLRYSVLHGTQPGGSGGSTPAAAADVDLIARGRTPYKRFHRAFMVDLRVEVRYGARRNTFIVPSDTTFAELAREAATFYGVAGELGASDAAGVAANLFDAAGAVCPPNTKIALMTVADDSRSLVLRCRRAPAPSSAQRRHRTRASKNSALDDDDDECNFIAGRDEDEGDEDNLPAPMLDDDDDNGDGAGGEMDDSSNRRGSDRGTGAPAPATELAGSSQPMSQMGAPPASEDYPGMARSPCSSQGTPGERGPSAAGPSPVQPPSTSAAPLSPTPGAGAGVAVPHCHVGPGAACVPGCIFVVGQAGALLAPATHPFADDRPARLCGAFVVTERGRLYECTVAGDRVCFAAPAGLAAVLRLHRESSNNSNSRSMNSDNGSDGEGEGDTRVHWAASTERELVVVVGAEERLYAADRATGAARALLPGVRVAQVSASHDFAAAVDRAGRVHVWGATLDLGVRSSRVPAAVPLAEPAAAAACGLSHVLVLARSGALYALGRGDEGRLGLGGEQAVCVPARVAFFGTHERSPVVSVACGRYHSAAVTAAGALYTWGSGKFGQLGHSTQANECTPRRVWGLRATRVAAVACEVLSTAACDLRGAVWTSGFRMTPPAVGGYSSDVLGCLPRYTLGDQHIAAVSASDAGFFLALRGPVDTRGTSPSDPVPVDPDSPTSDGDIEL